ncbi:MAG: hypothetical protein AAF579_20075 [Cyanobacteria bacterium P01_C01_bin.118]
MTTYPSNLQKLEVQRRRLEQQWQPATPAQKIKQASGNLLRNAGKWLVQTLTEGDQPRIWTIETSQGTRWCLRNLDEHRQFDSEDALRVWLEQRYYSK